MARQNAIRLSCQGNLRMIQMGISSYYNDMNYYPRSKIVIDKGPNATATYAWTVSVIDYLNSRLSYVHEVKDDGNGTVFHMEKCKIFQCPNYYTDRDSNRDTGTYIGITGEGVKSENALVTSSDAGFFGFPRMLQNHCVAKGVSYLAYIAESKVELGNWWSYSQVTLRAVDRKTDFMSSYGGLHADGKGRVVANVLFLDGTVRQVSNAYSNDTIVDMFLVNSKSIPIFVDE
ncbi:MAG: DUF1559 domain-containing protein [Gemmatales bacterium]